MERRIVVVGVGHVFDIAHHVTTIVHTVSPDIVALELDNKRLHALLNPNTVSSQGQPLIYRILAKMQQHIADKYGVTTGSEMKAAVTAAKEKAIGILCIDVDVQQLFRRLWHRLKFKQKVSLILGGLFSFSLKKEKVEQEIHSFEQNPVHYLEQLQTHFPEIGTVLIDERNEFMASHLIQALELYDTILAFVGEGHIPGLIPLIKDKAAVTVVHLSDVRNGSWHQQLGQ